MMSKHSIEPRWHSIAFLPVLAAAMRENADDVRKQAQRMAIALERALLLDRAELIKMDRVYHENASYVDVFGEQLRQWRSGDLTAKERETLDQLDDVLMQWHADVQIVADAIKTMQEGKTIGARRG